MAAEKKAPKAKVKQIPFGNTAIETPAGSGVFQWDCGKFMWRWQPGHGLNLQVVMGDVAQGVVHTDDLKSAAMYTEGFAGGYDANKGEPMRCPREMGGGPPPVLWEDNYQVS